MNDKPIVFMSEKELEEAITYKVVYKYKSYPSIFPWIKVLPLNDSIGCIHTHWSQERTIKALQESVLWSDIREQHLPKLWYLDERNKGKPIMVSDDKINWNVKAFESYDKLYKEYTTIEGFTFKYARPLTPDDTLLFGETK